MKLTKKNQFILSLIFISSLLTSFIISGAEKRPDENNDEILDCYNNDEESFTRADMRSVPSRTPAPSTTPIIGTVDEVCEFLTIIFVKNSLKPERMITILDIFKKLEIDSCKFMNLDLNSLDSLTKEEKEIIEKSKEIFKKSN